MKKLLVNTLSSLLLLAAGISTVWINQYYLPQSVGEPYLTMCGGLMLSGGALWFIPSVFDLFSTWEMEQWQRSVNHGNQDNDRSEITP